MNRDSFLQSANELDEAISNEDRERQCILLNLLKEKDWIIIDRNALAHAYNRHRYKLNDHILYEDVTQEAIIRTLECKRRINWSFAGYTKDTDLIRREVLYHLYNTIDSVISHWIKKSSRIVYFGVLEGEDTSSIRDSFVYQIPMAGETPEDDAQYQELTDYLQSAALDDAARKVLEVLIKNPDSTNKEIALELNENVNGVQNALRRLRRKLCKAIMKLDPLRLLNYQE